MCTMDRTKEVRETLFTLSSLSFNEWDKWFSDLDDRQIAEISDVASSWAVLLGMLSEYAGLRGGYGCGDSGHSDAMEATYKQRKRIRKALGYSYP